ncbi:peptide chain release factor 1-like, mitochondrial [Phlebotomus argentipes]|uniref:peptide chain release factor 1-like, mitochondrial n=1 Tax=Phlebotomus argentipes TaxID=94469 RepID=UPI002892B894|nr:peptide chain release factor 1-like, mitochondrial [Phlebotomus argentipes]
MLRKLFPGGKSHFLTTLRRSFIATVSVGQQRCYSTSLSSDSTDIWSKEAFVKYLEEIRKEFSESQHKGRRWHQLSEMCEVIDRRERIVENIATLRKIAQEEKDKEFRELAAEEEIELKNTLSEIHEELLQALVNESEGDNYQSFVLEVTAGVGGKEAMLFARDLYDMYAKYCDFRGWETEVLEEDQMEIGGIRHASLCITGQDAFQSLKREGGVHRVQRIPATEKSGRVHTSTVSVAIIPRPDDVTVVLHDKDLKIETKRATGAGGQHVNTTDSAVRITHLPSGMAVECQAGKSQIKNRELALKKLQARLYEVQLEAQLASTRSTRKKQVGTSMRNEKIRTYNFNQDRVTDHRIEDGTVHNLKGVLEGREVLDAFVAAVRERSREKLLADFLSDFQ